jgi:heme-degrading monooxygenase HmoA
MSFARSVSMRLKPNSTADFNRTIENEVVPILRQQKGFQDELVLVKPNGSEAIGISLWNNKESAEAYQRDGYPQVQKALSKVIEGIPQVQTYEVAHSTQQKSTKAGGGG